MFTLPKPSANPVATAVDSISMVMDPLGVKPDPVTAIPVPTLASVGFRVIERAVVAGVAVGSGELFIGVGSGTVVSGVSFGNPVVSGEDDEDGVAVSVL